MKIPTLLWCATVVAACANLPTPTPSENAQLAAARALLATDPHAACAMADELLAQNQDLRAARLVVAEGSWRLAQGDTRSRASLLEDAARNYELALAELPASDEPQAWRNLASCQYELGQFDAGSASAQRAAAGFAALGTGFARREAAAALLLAGKCDLQTFVDARQKELADGEPDRSGQVRPASGTAALAMRAASHFAAARQEFPGEATTQTAVIHRWLGQQSEATQELERGLRESPHETSIHDAYLAWLSELGQLDAAVGAYSRFVRENPATPILRWHQGRALYFRADRLRREGNFGAASEAYGKAEAAFGEYHAMVPGHADDTNLWRGLCGLSQACVATDAGDPAAAAEALLGALAKSERLARYDGDTPTVRDSFNMHFTAAVFVIHRALTESGDDALAKTLAFNERVLQACPDRWGFVYNNAALAARDLGVAKAKASDAAVAKDLWERSYAYYEKAVVLSPDDVRVVNDCGLMLVYHLHRDLDRARALFDRAIELGSAQLRALPADAERRERESLEEAVGDAYQNIAVLLRERQQRPFADYRPFCIEAVKYFPYERREAAGLLRSAGMDELASTARAGDPTAAAQGGAAEALAKVQPQIEAKVKAEDFDGALAVLDGIVAECKAHGPFHLQRGELTLQLAKQAVANGRKGGELFFQDAAVALQRAVELDPEPARPRQLLAQAQFDLNDMAAATATLSALLLHLQSQGGGQPADVLAAHQLRAQAAARGFVAKKSATPPSLDQELLAAARASFRLVEEKGQLGLDEVKLWASTEQWGDAAAAAVQVYARALQRSPDDQTLLAAVVDTAIAVDQTPVAVEALGKRTDATGLWYLGKARFAAGDAERLRGKIDAAYDLLDAASKAFQASMQQNDGYRDSCEQWLAMILGKKGNIAYRAKDLAKAEAWLLESLRLRPDQAGTDLGGGESAKLGVMLLADSFMKKQDLAKVEAIYRAASDAANSDADLLNNSGLFARDHGNALEAAGKQKEAMGMYEQSYKAYSRAQQLDPTNVRLRNDVALIDIYHLERDWDLSKRRLDSAIADGEAALKDAPPDDADARQKLEEAVGDCYENLALWHLKHSKDGAAAKAAAEQSLRFFPGDRRGGARRHLREAERLLQGK
jgi:hypothetical protein